MKVCIHCKQSLPVELFGKDKNTKDGLRRWCKDCVNETGRSKYNEHPSYRDHLKKRYGITPQQYQAIRNVQGSACYICGARPERLVVDHDHETRVVRGLLCRHCNFLLGNSKESPDILRRAADYLELRHTYPLMIDWRKAQEFLNTAWPAKK